MKVLIVDDDPHIVQILRTKLEESPHTLFEARNGLEAIKTALREVPDLILLDIMMPDIDGYQVCRFIRSVPSLQSTRIIFLTVKKGVGDRQRGILRGADDYLYKPFKLEDIEEKVRYQLARERSTPDASPTGGVLQELPAPEDITDEIVISIMNRLLDENVHRFSLLEKISERLLSTVDRGEIIRTMAASLVSPVGLAWDRLIVVGSEGNGGPFRGELAFGFEGEEGEGRRQWQRLVMESKDRTMEELFEGNLDLFSFQKRGSSAVLDGIDFPADPEILSIAGAAVSTPLRRSRKVWRSKELDRRLEKIFGGSSYTVVPLAGRERLFGFVAVDRQFSRAGIHVEDVDHLWFLSCQTGLALERQELFRQSEQRAREYEDLSLLNENILRGIGLGVAFVDGEGRIVTWNSAMSQFSGLNEEEVKGREFFELFHSLRGTLAEERYNAAASDGSSQRVGHFPHLLGKGAESFFDIRFNVVRQKSRNLGIVMIWEDVSVRVSLERKAKEAFQYLSSLIDHSGDAIVTVDTDGTIKRWSGSAADIFGYREPEVLGKNLAFLADDESGVTVKEILERTLLEGKVVNSHDTYINRAGEPVGVSVTASLIETAEGGKGDIAAIIRDVSERRRMESQLFQTEKLASLGIMAAGMAHEINNPLTSIIMFAQILAMKKEITEEDRKCVDRIDEDAGRIADIVNSLLVFSRPSSRVTEEVDVSIALRRALDFAQYQMDDKAITVDARYTEENFPVCGIVTEVQEIFLNLLINARDALPKGGKIEVGISYLPPAESLPAGLVAEEESGYMVVVISDEGSGMPKETQKKIFDPFFTTKEPGKGTGLGLAVVKSLVNGHKGHITVDSRPGEGTVFTVYLPVSKS